jgi:REP element-mobilizing transposase RayT
VCAHVVGATGRSPDGGSPLHDGGSPFGEIINGKMHLNSVGRIVSNEWVNTAAIRKEVVLDEYIVMPDHFHGILVITDRTWPITPTAIPDRRGDLLVAPVPPVARSTVAPNGPPPGSVGAIIAGFKSAATKRINESRGTPGAPVWQRNYYEHIIRDDNALHQIRQYIINNPMRWATTHGNMATVLEAAASRNWAADG